MSKQRHFLEALAYIHVRRARHKTRCMWVTNVKQEIVQPRSLRPHESCYRASGIAIDGSSRHRRGATSRQRVSRLAVGHASPVPGRVLKAAAVLGRQAVERVRASQRGRAKAC
eukprot:6178620-Pleurochrysis_carterae.AAC.1